MNRISAALFVALVTVSASTQNKPAAAQATFHIRGVVLNAVGGEPVQNAQVLIRPTNVRAQQQTMITGDDGRFDFAGLTAGKYSLGAQGQGFSLQALDEHENYSTGVAVGTGLDSEHIVFRLEPEGSIRGKVLDEFGEPVAEARVLLFYSGLVNGRGGAHSAGQTGTNDLGEFGFSHLPQGNYKLAVMAQPWYADATHRASELDVAYPVTYFAGVTEAQQATAIVVRPGDRAEADFALRAVHTVHLPVSGDQFSTRITQQIFDHAEDAPLVNISGDQNSKSIALPPGSYVADLYSGEEGTDKWRTTRLNVSDDTDLDPKAAASSSPTISATMHFADAATKAEGLTLELHNFDNGEIRQGQANAKGEVQFDSSLLRSGRYYVMLRSRGFHIATVEASGATVNGRSIEVPESGAVRLNVTLARGMGRVDGVALRDGKPFAGALVLLVPENPVGNYTLFRRDQSDSDGTFTLPLVVPGKYTAVAITDGWELEWSNPEVLKRYMAAGTKTEVTNGPLKIQVKVQLR